MNERPALDTTALRDGLTGLPWQCVDVVEETGSTNADLLARAAAGEDIAGAVLFAEYQNAGRGRHGRTWTAPPRSQLVVSFGVDAAAVPTSAWGWLPLTTGLAVLDALDEVAGVNAGLKWPNDVLAGPPASAGKLAGILAEVASPAQVIVVGLGLNVTMTAQEAPDPRATSLAQLGATELDRTMLGRALLRHLATRLDSWRRSDPALADDYRARSMTVGSRVRAILPGDRTVEGVADSVDELGRLVIDTGAGPVMVSAGDITHLRPLES
ncbi:biotin--[acetyl-CoA-carboxylase] ligase [Mycobacterium sp. 21AC1]|uniref:biotin--[acetyl-CoA-carboxylase] ligase n=1 Tax=[Mycobacterium] appelbergii TaxID=2939269 RepID=UPI002938DD20|nr:biotin--[acetyl-CoA-carboxylase] ligase [Mycobacterium sp. 21AC1]MDV3126896.1 biotin--[acetyl-CoA-carboxylase] ligase [Mycobacterium sp. 21AC1]